VTWTLKVRSAGGGTIPHEYLCPEHGRFTAEVSREDVPDEMPCPEREPRLVPATQFLSLSDAEKLRSRAGNPCGLTSPWSPSGIACKVPLASFNRGKSEAPPNRNALTTRDLADGMPMSEWRAKRAKLHEERRRKRIKEML
jgi:hypothetical protein